MTRRIRWALSFLVVAACEATPPAPVATTIQVSLPVVMLQAGSTTTATAVVRDQHGQPMTAQAVTWSSSDASLATISSSGEVTAVAAGEVTIRATAGQAVGSAGLTITHDPNKVARVVISPDSARVLLGQSQAFTAKVFNALGNELIGRTITWSSSDPRIAGLHSQGIATAINAGKARIIAMVEGVSASVPFQARVHPLKATSYLNLKESGVQRTNVPTSHQLWGVLGRAYGDFTQTGEITMFVPRAPKSIDPAVIPQAQYTFYRLVDGRWQEDMRASINYNGVDGCFHPAKGLTADFNGDKIPDVFIACSGIDHPPFAGERNQILLSQGPGKYILQYAHSLSAYWHETSAADLDGDGDVDVMAVDGRRFHRFINNGDGTFKHDRVSVPLATESFSRSYYVIEIADVDEDGRLDVLAGGHDWRETPHHTPEALTAIWINPGNSDFSTVQPVIIPRVQNEGIITDFIITGTGATRTVWVARTSGGDGTSYESAVLQRFNWSTRTSEVVFNHRRAPGSYTPVWAEMMVKYNRNGAEYIGADHMNSPIEHRIN